MSLLLKMFYCVITMLFLMSNFFNVMLYICIAKLWVIFVFVLYCALHIKYIMHILPFSVSNSCFQKEENEDLVFPSVCGLGFLGAFFVWLFCWVFFVCSSLCTCFPNSTCKNISNNLGHVASLNSQTEDWCSALGMSDPAPSFCFCSFLLLHWQLGE